MQHASTHASLGRVLWIWPNLFLTPSPSLSLRLRLDAFADVALLFYRCLGANDVVYYEQNVCGYEMSKQTVRVSVRERIVVVCRKHRAKDAPCLWVVGWRSSIPADSV